MGRNKNVKKAKMEFLEMGGKKERKRARWLKQQFRHRRRDQQTGRHRRENRQAGEGAAARPGRARRRGRSEGEQASAAAPHFFILSGFSSGVELPVSEQLCCVATSRCFRVRRYLLTPWDGNENSVLPASLPPTHSGPVPLPGVAMPVLR